MEAKAIEDVEGLANKIPFYSKDSIDIIYSPDKGRYVVSNRDILSGEEVMTGVPYAFSVSDTCKQQFCSNCFKLLDHQNKVRSDRKSNRVL